MKKILVIIGTRPEAIKLAPLVIELKKDKKHFKVSVVITAQHREMLDQVLTFFKIKPNFDLNLMKPGQSLFDTTADGLRGIERSLKSFKPDLIIVQGDTTTAFIGALAGHYLKIKVAHIEAGLRTNEKFSPFPEEINRRLISQLADYHFTPTVKALNNLKKEGFKDHVYLVGNTVIDALKLGLNIIKKDSLNFSNKFTNIDFNKKIILITGHRRENFGDPLKSICSAYKELALQFPHIELVYPVHLNPSVKIIVHQELKSIKNIHLIEPLKYQQLIWLMNKCYFIITDSGGIQEEAPYLGKPVLITRKTTERPEGINAGTALLVGHDRKKIIKYAKKLLTKQSVYIKMSKAQNPYGNGLSSQKIAKILRNIK